MRFKIMNSKSEVFLLYENYGTFKWTFWLGCGTDKCASMLLRKRAELRMKVLQGQGQADLQGWGFKPFKS